MRVSSCGSSQVDQLSCLLVVTTAYSYLEGRDGGSQLRVCLGPVHGHDGGLVVRGTLRAHLHRLPVQLVGRGGEDGLALAVAAHKVEFEKAKFENQELAEGDDSSTRRG
jgi:hypothetical protein